MKKDLESIVALNYEDQKGVFSVTFNEGGKTLDTLLEKYNVNLSEYFPIGFEIEKFSAITGSIGIIDIAILAVKKEHYGGNFESVKRKILEDERNVSVDKIKIPLKLDEFNKVFKHFKLISLNYHREYIDTITFNKE
ncbi:conserved protein of unknown function [Tenacibaculum sp. 190524A02b]|uniref:hypothetical protein n=1 Tax=Tenacibaculum vairaonense TaxID=3137860 RepID=UPI0032B2B9DB